MRVEIVPPIVTPSAADAAIEASSTTVDHCSQIPTPQEVTSPGQHRRQRPPEIQAETAPPAAVQGNPHRAATATNKSGRYRVGWACTTGSVDDMAEPLEKVAPVLASF